MAFFHNGTMTGVPMTMGTFLNQGEAVCDAGQVIAAENLLKAVEAQIFKRPTPPLKSGLLIYRKLDAGAWARSTSFMTMDGSAEMRPIGGKANDLPMAIIGLDEKVSPVRDFGVAYGYDRKELIIATKLNIPLDGDKALMCMQAYETRVDELAAIGDKSLGIVGILSGGNGIPRESRSTTIDEGSSASDILKLLNDIETSVVDNTNETASPDTIALPLLAHNYIAQTLMNSAGGSKTIKQVFLENSPNIRQIIPWNRCKNAGSKVKDAANRHAMVCLKALDPLICRQQIPEAFTPTLPQQVGLSVVVNCVASIGSVEIIQPKAISIFEFPAS